MVLKYGHYPLSRVVKASTTSYAIADGYTTYFNGYDNSIYVVGRGTSQTTVSATPSVSTLGSYVVIQGTVMDISAGTKQNQQAATSLTAYQWHLMQA